MDTSMCVTTLLYLKTEMNLLFLYVTVLSITQTYGLLTVTTNTSYESFITTRYSYLMGSFTEQDCTLNATGVLFLEDGCNRNDIKQNLQNAIVFIQNSATFLCYEETVYANLESLGALAVIHFDDFPAGTRINKINLGKEPKSGSIPFLDMGNFFDASLIEEQDFTVSVEICEDENPFKTCLRPVAAFRDLSSVGFYIIGLHLTMKILKNTKEDHGTRPRRYILKVQAVNFALSIVKFFLGLGSYESYFWITGVVPAGIQHLIFLAWVSLSNYIILLCSAYWYFLSCQLNVTKQGLMKSNCFVTKKTSSSFFDTNAFMHAHLAPILVFCAMCFGYLQPQPKTSLLAQVLGGFSFFLMVVFTMAHYRLNSVTTNTIWNRTDATWKYNKLDLLTGKAVKRLIKNHPETSSVSSFIMRLQLHLGMWLQVALCGRIAMTVCLVLYTSVFPLEGANFYSFSTQKCVFLLPSFGIAVSNALLELALVEGIKGPEAQDKTVTHQLTHDENPEATV